MKASRRHFTLIEVLVVVLLIGILSAIGFGAYSYAMNSAREKSTRALFKRVEAALESCKTKCGYLPPSANNSYSEITFVLDDGIVEEIRFGGTNGTFRANGDDREKAFLKEFLRVIDPESLKKNLRKNTNDYTLVDSWGKEINYGYPGRFNTTGYDILSAGPDGIFGEGGTPSSAPPTSIDKYKNTNGEAVCDDLFNF